LGTRYKGLKQVDGILENGSPILEYSIYDALEAGFNKIAVVINQFIPERYIERLEKISKMEKFELKWIYQEMEKFVPKEIDISSREKPWGTGHAILCAKEMIKEPFVIINADDFYGKEAYQLASREMDLGNISEFQFELIAYPVETTLSKNGAVARGVCALDSESYLLKIKEQTSLRKENSRIIYTENETDIEIKNQTLVSMNFFVFHPSIFNSLENYFIEFIKSNPLPKEEFYVPFAIQKMITTKKVKVLVKSSPSQWMGMTYPNDKIILKNYLEKQIQRNRYPANLWK
jgi:UTP-glucose-1-phosphate uridylyltransferase